MDVVERALSPSKPSGARTKPAAPRPRSALPVKPCNHVDDELHSDGHHPTSPTCSTISSLSLSGCTSPPPLEEFRLIEIAPEALIVNEQVHSGCTTEVFRGHWDSKTVAIKRFFKRRNLDLNFQMYLQQEMSVLAQIEHPNIVKLLGGCFKAPPYQIVTDFCEGGTLHDLLHYRDELDLSWHQQLKMCKDPARAMAYLHSKSILHRDLRSPNLLLAARVLTQHDEPWVKLSGFGVIKKLDMENSSPTKMTSKVETLRWIAPEMSIRPDYDVKVDVYSYAIVLFEVICRSPPFEDMDPENIEQFVNEGGRPDLELIPCSCPAALRSIMVAGWAQDPKERPTFGTILKELDSIDEVSD